jgi:hypothetical protein
MKATAVFVPISSCLVKMYFGTQRNNSKTFSGIFCSNRGNQPIALLDLPHLLPLKVK